MTLLVALFLFVTAPIQDTPAAMRAKGNELLEQSRYAEAEQLFAIWQRAHPGDADANYLLAVSRALQGKTDEAREGFLRVVTLDPRRADACFELAASYVKTSDHRRALDWAVRGLSLAPNDEYGLDVAGTAFYLNGSKDEALKCWNRLGRPHLTDIRIAGSGVTRQSVADEIGLAPGDLLSLREIQKARWRLAQHGYFRSVVFDPVPGDSPNEYSLQVTADARRGVGTWPELLLNTFADVNFRMLRFDYWNIGGSTASVSARWRWLATARWTEAQLNLPRLAHVPLYWTLAFDQRDEAWRLQPASVPFHLHTQAFTARMALPVRLPYFSMTAGLEGRRRTFTPDVSFASPESGGTWTGPLSDRAAGGVAWLRAEPRLVLPVERLTTSWLLRGQLRGAIEGGWTSIAGDRTALSRGSLSAEARVDRTVGGVSEQSVALGVHGGWLSSRGLVEDHFVLGIGPDADFPLRAHPYLGDGHPGVAPLASRFTLCNLTGTTDLFKWGWFKLGAQAFADTAWLQQDYPGQGLPKSIFDTGVGLDFGSALLGGGKITVAWGHDWQGHRNVVYVGTTLR